MSDLCQRCALCCDGALFDAVPLAPAETDAIRRRLVVLATGPGHARSPPPPGIDVHLDATSPRLPQPCAALRGRRCAIYDDRPDACRRYRCMLLAALDAGEVDAGEAAAVVAEAHARLAALANDLPGEGPVLARARAAARAGHLSPETHALLGRAAAFLERRFRGHTRR